MIIQVPIFQKLKKKKIFKKDNKPPNKNSAIKSQHLITYSQLYENHLRRNFIQEPTAEKKKELKKDRKKEKHWLKVVKRV